MTPEELRALSSIAYARSVRENTPPRFRGGLNSLLAAAPRLAGEISKARAWVEAFERRSGRALYLYGPKGTGKTGIGYGVCLEVAARLNFVEMSSFPELLRRIRASYGIGALENENDIIRDCQDTDLLFLDDLGAANLTAHAADVLYAVLDHRYGEKKPVLLTSDMGLKALQSELARPKSTAQDGTASRAQSERICSRIAEMIADPGDVIQFKGRDLRIAKPKGEG